MIHLRKGAWGESVASPLHHLAPKVFQAILEVSTPIKLKALAHSSHQQEWGASIDPQPPSLGNLGKGAFLGASSEASAEFQPMTVIN